MTPPPVPNGHERVDEASSPSRSSISGSGGTSGRFSFIFAWELHERLLWFSNLRWLAVGGLAAVSLFGPAVGMGATRPSLMVIAALVAAYNLIFVYALRYRLGPEEDYGNLRTVAILLRRWLAGLRMFFKTCVTTGLILDTWS